MRIAHLLIYHEQPERIAHGRSFVLRDLSDLLMVAHFLWVTCTIRSRSLICLERTERIAYSRSFDLSEMSEWANSQPCLWLIFVLLWVNIFCQWEQIHSFLLRKVWRLYEVFTWEVLASPRLLESTLSWSKHEVNLSFWFGNSLQVYLSELVQKWERERKEKQKKLTQKKYISNHKEVCYNFVCVCGGWGWGGGGWGEHTE